ncbi:MAG TPA: hypothetical protein VFQ60_02280 [Patescibacteria group bacterium]|nr:hypothetical protein [Patescibacteria group bacterium]
MKKLFLSCLSFGCLIAFGAGCSSSSGQTVSTNTPKKVAVPCSFYDKKFDLSKVPPDLRDAAAETMKDANFVAGDRGNLPADFPAVVSDSSLCGSIKKLRTSYFLTNLSDDQLFAEFKQKLAAYGCQTDTVHQGDKGLEYLYFLPFTCGGTRGLVGPDAFHKAYFIVYPSL